MAEIDQNHPRFPQTFLVTCKTEGCKNQGKEWRIWPVNHLPGLLQIPNVLCAECSTEPERVR